jgi:hypothetical protein
MISEFILINVKANYTIEASFLFYSNAGYCSYLCSFKIEELAQATKLTIMLRNAF